MKFALERLADILAEVEELWHAHWKETEGYRDSQGYNPDHKQYLRVEAQGAFLEYTARDEEGKLAGHVGYILHVSRHTSKLNAVEDYFYMRPECRGRGAASGLLRFAIADLQRRGCKQVGMSSKLTHDIEPLLAKVGFKHVAKFFVMEV